MKRWQKYMVFAGAAGLILMGAFGCAATRGGAGVEWGSQDPPEIRGDHKPGPPAHAPAHGYRAKHRYRYYPDREVYFDAGRRLYFYLEGTLWKSGVSLPYHLRVDLGRYEMIEIDADTPYAYHAKYKAKPGNKVPPGQAKNKSKWF